MVEFCDYPDHHHRTDPLASERHQPFDWQSVFESCDGEQADSDMVSREKAAEALAALLRWICDSATGPTVQGQALPGIARRAIAALHVVSPETFTGTPAQRELCARFRMSHAWLSAPVSEFTRLFRIQNRFQSHGRGGSHRQKLRVEFRPEVAFVVPVAVAPAVSAGEVQTPSDATDAPTGKERS